MGKMKIRLFPDGTIQMETEGIKGERCKDYAKVLQRLTDAKIYDLQKTDEYYSKEILETEEIRHLHNTDY